jgi:hypothetical protein
MHRYPGLPIGISRADIGLGGEAIRKKKENNQESFDHNGIPGEGGRIRKNCIHPKRL